MDRTRNWWPKYKNIATMTVKDGDNSAQSLSKLMSSTIESPWQSHSLDPQITITFYTHVTFLDVVLRAASENIKESFKNIRLVVKF